MSIITATTIAVLRESSWCVTQLERHTSGKAISDLSLLAVNRIKLRQGWGRQQSKAWLRSTVDWLALSKSLRREVKLLRWMRLKCIRNLNEYQENAWLYLVNDRQAEVPAQEGQGCSELQIYALSHLGTHVLHCCLRVCARHNSKRSSGSVFL